MSSRRNGVRIQISKRHWKSNQVKGEGGKERGRAEAWKGRGPPRQGEGPGP